MGAVAIEPSGKLIAAGATTKAGNVVFLHPTPANQRQSASISARSQPFRFTVSRNGDDPKMALAFPPGDCRSLAVGTGSGLFMLYDIEAGAMIRQFSHHRSCGTVMGFHPAGNLIATGGGHHLRVYAEQKLNQAHKEF